MKIPKLTHIKIEERITILAKFEDGTIGIIDFDKKVLKGILSKLQDHSFFNLAKLKEGVIYWPEEIEICGDSLYLELKEVTFDEWQNTQLINA